MAISLIIYNFSSTMYAAIDVADTVVKLKTEDIKIFLWFLLYRFHVCMYVYDLTIMIG